MADIILLFLLENGKKWGAFSKGHTDKQVTIQMLFPLIAQL